MARKKRVAAHFMHEHEEAVAWEVLQKKEVNPAFMIGVTDAAGIRKMRKKGLMVEELGDVEQPAAEAHVARRGPRGIRPALAGRPAAAPPPRRPTVFPAQVEIGIAGPLTGQRHQELAATGCTIKERQVDGTLLLSVDTATQLRSVRGLEFVNKVQLTEPPAAPAAATRRPRIAGVAPARRGRAPRRGRAAVAAIESDTGLEADLAAVHDVTVREGGNLRDIKQWLEQQPGAFVVKSSKRKLRVLIGPTLAQELRRRPDVELVSEVRPRNLKNDVALELTHSSEVKVEGVNGNFTLTGEGEIVAVADSGIDESHPDFKNRIIAVKSLGRNNDASDFHGHGTHVAGTILGDGKASRKKLRGVAPRAKLYFQSLMDEHGSLGGLPLDLADLFEPAYKKGARIHNNSWGAALYGRFTVDSLEVDRFISDHPDMLVVLAAGNDGSLRQSENYPHQTAADEVELLSLGSPATCKNGLVVGASRNKRKRGGLARHTHKEVWPDEFNASTGVAVEKVSGNADEVAGFSSRGPSDDERIKPDLVAPGTDILSTRSKDAPSSNFWGTHSAFNNRYAYMGGTSMATPLVSGCAALVREYYRSKRGLKKPSAALIKATLIDGCRWLSGSGAMAAPSGEPNFHQGFGCLDLANTIPPKDTDFRLAYVDTWRKPGMAIDSTNRHRWRFELTRKQDLRICFAYTDTSARGLQNVMYILVEEPAGGAAKHFGNEKAPKGLIRGPDTKNNVEVVHILDAVPGEYLIQVAAHSLLSPPQHYALVICGSLKEVGGAAANDSPFSADLIEQC